MTTSAITEPRDNVWADRERRLGAIPRPDRDARPWPGYKKLLRRAGLRPTRQRMILGWLLFSQGNRHITAEMLYDEAIAAKCPVSLGTVYNTLNQFTEAGLLRQIGVDGAKSFFDTNPSEHHHFFVEDEQAVIDIPTANVAIDQLPQAPAGYEIARIDVTVRLRRKQG